MLFLVGEGAQLVFDRGVFAWTFVIILLSAGFEKLFLLLLDRVTRAVTGEVPQC